MRRIRELSKMKKLLLLVVAPSVSTFGLLSMIDFDFQGYVLNWTTVAFWTVLFLILYLFSLALLFYIYEISRLLVTFFGEKRDGHRPG